MPAPEAKLNELLHDFDVAMLATRTGQGQLRARPMHLADIQPDGTIWLVTDRDSAKVAEIERDVQVNVSMQSKAKFISISGIASPVEDRDKIAQLWKEHWKVWFPGGKDDPKLLLLCVRGQMGEYWDSSGASGIRYLFEAGKAYFTGTRPEEAGDPKVHGKVNL
jgi:general stress protein 26